MDKVIATKYTTNFRSGPGSTNIMSNYQGNGSKSLHVSVNNSLKKLATDYIDLVSIHILGPMMLD
jgi:aryl-alcohol dehydrogenase-like predicted oxidoreductase